MRASVVLGADADRRRSCGAPCARGLSRILCVGRAHTTIIPDLTERTAGRTSSRLAGDGDSRL
jgi:hypothetical protein